MPVITFDQAVSVHLQRRRDSRVIHFPHGHTDGDSVIFFTGSNVVHMGDNFFDGRFPVVDLEAGGDVEGMTKNIGGIVERSASCRGVKIIPGHGPLSDVEGLKTFHRMLLETTDIVRKRMAAGKTLDQIKAEGLPEEWKSWGSGFHQDRRLARADLQQPLDKASRNANC